MRRLEDTHWVCPARQTRQQAGGLGREGLRTAGSTWAGWLAGWQDGKAAWLFGCAQPLVISLTLHCACRAGRMLVCAATPGPARPHPTRPAPPCPHHDFE